MSGLECFNGVVAILSLLLNAATVAGALTAAYFAYRTFQEQAAQVSTMKKQLSLERSLLEANIRATSPVLSTPDRIQNVHVFSSPCGKRFFPDSTIWPNRPQNEVATDMEIRAVHANEPGTRFILAHNILPENTYRLAQGALVDPPQGFRRAVGLWKVTETKRVVVATPTNAEDLDLWIISIAAERQELFTTQNYLDIELRFQTVGGIRTVQRYRVLLTTGEIVIVEDEANASQLIV